MVRLCLPEHSRSSRNLVIKPTFWYSIKGKGKNYTFSPRISCRNSHLNNSGHNRHPTFTRVNYSINDLIFPNLFLKIHYEMIGLTVDKNRNAVNDNDDFTKHLFLILSKSFSVPWNDKSLFDNYQSRNIQKLKFGEKLFQKRCDLV